MLSVPVPSIALSDWPNIVSAMEKMRLTGPAWAGEKDPRLRRRGIIFTRSKRRCDAIYESLSATWALIHEMCGVQGAGGGDGEGMCAATAVDGMHVVKYHSEMDEDARKESFGTFTSDKPGLVVMVATTAAGVSLDHDRVRWTIHEGGVYGDNNMVQETGRAGRDQKPALAVLLVDDETQPWMMQLEREARSSPNARLLHEEYPPIKAASIRRARQMLEYGIAGGMTHVISVGGIGWGSRWVESNAVTHTPYTHVHGFIIIQASACAPLVTHTATASAPRAWHAPLARCFAARAAASCAATSWRIPSRPPWCPSRYTPRSRFPLLVCLLGRDVTFVGWDVSTG